MVPHAVQGYIRLDGAVDRYWDADHQDCRGYDPPSNSVPAGARLRVETGVAVKDCQDELRDRQNKQDLESLIEFLLDLWEDYEADDEMENS